MISRVLSLIVLTLVVSCLGCGNGRPDRFPVSGQVLIDGKPLEHGFVQIMPKDGRAASGKIGPDGKFQLTTYEPNDGCLPGKHIVTVIAKEETGPHSRRWHAPKKYMDPTTSGLTADITEPTDSLKIELTWDGGKPFEEKDGGGKE